MNVFFQPFVGKDYTTGGIFGKRIMVLGESHYCDEGCTDCGNVANHRECRTFTQVAMGGPRKAGSDAEYRQAEEAFFSVLDQYRPQYIIAWGNRLWGEMPGGERWQDGDDITIDGYTVNTGSYALSGGRRVKVMAVNHPSVGYSWDWWHKVIETFLKR